MFVLGPRGADLHFEGTDTDPDSDKYAKYATELASRTLS